MSSPAPISQRNGPAAAMLAPARTVRLQRTKCACGKPVTANGECTECRRKRLQRSGAGSSPLHLPSSVQTVLQSPGQPLEPSARREMESGFGRDFSQVRVHTGSYAADSARDVNARAYTVGQNIVFGSGHDPFSPSTRSLLAHELAHTVQQAGLQCSTDLVNLDTGPEYQQLEAQAEAAAQSVLQGTRPTHLGAASQGILSRAAAAQGTVVPGKPKKPKPITTDFGTHTVTPSEGFVSTDGKIEEFDVSVLYVPGEKGKAALDEYKLIQGGKLESTVSLTGTGRARTALWQTRPSTDTLQKLWLDKVGWSPDSKDDLWHRAGGDTTFPKVGNSVCQMDHIIELQLGGENTTSNIQPLNAGPNQASGRDINRELTQLVQKIQGDPALASDDTEQFKMRFKTAMGIGTVYSPQKDCPPKAPVTCLDVEKCAKGLKITKDESGRTTIEGVDYPIKVGGGSPRNLRVPTTFAKAKDEVVPIEADATNKSVATIIPGLLLTELMHRKGAGKKQDIINARIDDRPETRLPLSLDAKTKSIVLEVDTNGVVSLDPAHKKGGLAFTYKYLSPGKITSMSFNEAGGMDWSGTITPSIPLLGPLEVAYQGGELTLSKGLNLKSPFPGVRIIDPKLSLKLSEPFTPTGTVGLEFGPQGKPLAKANLSASTDGKGLIVSGQLQIFIPGVDKAEATVTYKGGGEYGAGQWTGNVVIESSSIKLPYVSSGSVTAQLGSSQGITVDGKVNLSLPGENTATVGLKKTEQAWIFSGGGHFKIPRVGEVDATVQYNTATEVITAGANNLTAQFKFLGLSATLNEINCEIPKGGRPAFWGAASLSIKKGKVDGHADLKLNRNGRITGTGTVTYPLRDNLIVTGTVILDEKEQLAFQGELVLTRLELFEAKGGEADIFSIDLPFPIPGLSLGTAGGVIAHVRGGMSAGYSFGPGVIEPLKFSAGFKPLEENPDVELGVSGRLSIPAKAWITAKISGGVAIEVNAYLAKAGAEGGLEFSGKIELNGEVFSTLDAHYKARRLTAKMTAGLQAELVVGAKLTAYVMAYAKALGFGVDTRYDWTLAEARFPTGLQFKLSAPFDYDSDKPIKLPEAKDVEITKPKIELPKILGDAFGRKPASSKQI